MVADRLKTHGAVLITGSKAVGKTTTARLFAASEVRLHQDRAALTAARTDPRLVLDGDSPRLVAEYHLAQGLWEAIRGRIDDMGGKGLFLLAAALSEPTEKEAALGFMDRLLDLARLADADRVVGTEPFHHFLDGAPTADVNNFGMSPELSFDLAREMVERTSSTCLFVRDSGEESALA